jgi:hypothetical protein
MTLAHAPEGADSADESGPDSANLRVSQNTAYESGIPPARDRLARANDTDAALEQLELVLVESTRAEANLGLLLRGLKHLAAGAATAQEANAILVQELGALRVRLSKVYESESLLQHRVHTLENALDAAARERESWLVQEDAFLAALLDEHEQKMFDAGRQHERRLAELDLAFDELTRERDNARTEVQRLTYERDAAVALLNEPVASTERTPSPSPSSPVSSGRLGSVKLPKPILKPKPSAQSGGYSLRSEELAEEHFDNTPTSRPPRP